MKALLFWLVVTAGAAGLAWWIDPRAPEPDLSAFGDGGAAATRAAPAWPEIPRGVAVRYAVALRTLPALGGLFLVALAAGLFRRERASYASPALAWIGKRVALGGLAVLALFVVTPFSWPMWGPYLGGGVGALGVLTYVGNLPRRL